MATEAQNGGEGREFDVVLMGATGYCGNFAAEYLAENYPPSSGVKWALAGRSLSKLEKVRGRLQAIVDWADEIELIPADSGDEDALRSLVQRTKAVATVVGPYALYGTLLVKLCVEQGTHYVDITGETQWIQKMIRKYNEKAEKDGTFIIPSCGFDSVPSDIGTFLLAEHMSDKYKQGLGAVECGLSMKSNDLGNRADDGAEATGLPGGGTIFSLLNASAENKDVFFDAYSLVPEDAKIEKPDKGKRPPFWPSKSAIDSEEPWSTHFVMAWINEKTVRRSAALLPKRYGTNFSYKESMMVSNVFMATFITFVMALLYGAVNIIPKEYLMKVLPKPSNTPPKRPKGEYLRGGFKFVLKGVSQDGKHNARATVVGKADGGYGETSKMLIEAALCLVLNRAAVVEESGIQGGVVTPAVMGRPYVDRLVEKDMELYVEELEAKSKRSRKSAKKQA
mmetsp:Transcript_21184/g.39401  ORF Transcript_21184/g.39401 Transcript_21184/m.39401 type:complete len:451 (+) Transcript_21184:210-1562(+)